MNIAVLSGKGGAGKTFVAVNLAAAAKNAVYIDCDVEEPNGRLFLKPERIEERTICTKLPVFDAEKCIGCRKCVDICRFNTLVYLKGKPMVFGDVCHSCGGCSLVCPTDAITETDRPIGHVESGMSGGVRVVTGVLNYGEASGVPIIEAALEACGEEGLTVIDCPPGSACSVTESVSKADYCILVAEPTAFGFHNFRMVHELVTLLGKPCGVVINKQDMPYKPLEDFCREKNLPILLRIPFSEKTAQICAEGRVAGTEDTEIAAMFDGLLHTIGGGAQ